MVFLVHKTVIKCFFLRKLLQMYLKIENASFLRNNIFAHIFIHYYNLGMEIVFYTKEGNRANPLHVST